MQHFKADKKSPKATLEIDGKTYEFYSPETGQVTQYQKQILENSGNVSVQSEIAIEYLSSLSNGATTDVLKRLDNELFDELFMYVISPQKKR